VVQLHNLLFKMGLLDDIIALDSQLAFADTDAFAESVTYKPRSGTNRTISAQVFRNLEPMQDMNGAIRYPILIVVANSATTGISATELDSGADKINLPWRQAGDVKDYPLGQPESQDAGMLTFRIFGSSR